MQYPIVIAKLSNEKKARLNNLLKITEDKLFAQIVCNWIISLNDWSNILIRLALFSKSILFKINSMLLIISKFYLFGVITVFQIQFNY